MTKASIAIPADPVIACPPDSNAMQRMLVIVKRYVQLTKTGIVFGNLISVAGGFFLAARGHVDPWLFLATITGVSLIVASGCVFNNYIDRDIDAKMKRTQNRVMVQKLVAPRPALIFAGLLGLAGLAVLLLAVNMLSAVLAAFGFLIYVGVYSLYMKRHSVLGTLVGSLSGAMPPVIGYCAVSNHFDMGAGILLLTFCLWQMPHSYAIAILYLDDYAAAGIPVLPVHLGVPTAKKRIIAYIPAFTLAALLLTVAGYTGYAYFAVTAFIGAYWLYAAFSGYRRAENRVWARRMFVFSIVSIMALSLMMSVDFYRL